ncbi:hypothetical protein KC349_g3046 [Hortaea werneckii]|nr:hypothetical protein KC349_g3046 [Hortaea werneckii]
MSDPLTAVAASASVVQLIDFTTKILTRLNEYRAKAGELPSAFAYIAKDLLITIQQMLAPPDPFLNLHKALKLRSANTGKWFLQGVQFEACKAQSPYFGWLHGSAGSGKTILSATIIENLQHFCRKDPARSLALFFFDFNNAAKQDANNMVKSLLGQFLQRCTRIPDAAQRLSTTASEQQLLNALRETMEMLPIAFVVLDALDECNDRERLFEILKEMQSWENKSLHIIVTSRKDVDIEDELEDLILPDNRICLESHVVDRDIRTYVHERLTEDKAFKRWEKDPEIQEEIKLTLGKNACGMFRWAACQLDTLAHCFTRGKVRRALQDLPKTLYDTYDCMIRMIDESQNAEEALKILRFLTYAQRPPSANELLEVTGIFLEEDGSRFDKDEVLKSVRDISRICIGLVSIVPAVQDLDSSGDASQTSDTFYIGSNSIIEPSVRLAHFSVKEYLTSIRPCIEKFSLREKESHDILANCCLMYLHRFEKGEWSDPECETKFPLARYAAVYWTTHARISDFLSHRQRDLCLKLLTDNLPAYRAWHRFYDMSYKWKQTSNICREIREFPSPLFSASSEGLLHAVNAILEDEMVNIDATWELEGTALCGASKMGYGRIVEMLLAKGADANVQRDQGSHALVEATLYGSKKIVERLLDVGADVRAKQMPYGTAPDVASVKGDKKMMEILLPRVANFESRGDIHGRALIKASRMGHNDLVEMLLARGADIDFKDPSGDTALAVASSNSQVRTVEILLANGADTNLQGREHAWPWHGTALGAALPTSGVDSGASEKIVEMLLANGADVEARGVGSQTPLQLASYWGKTKIVQVLLAQGADVNARPGCWCGSAMRAASNKRNQEIIQMLQAKGAKLWEGELIEILKWEHVSDSLFETFSGRSVVAEPCPPALDEL